MKALNIISMIATLAIFTGCMTNGVHYSKKNPSEFTAEGWKGGSISTEGEKLSDTRYFISVKGAAVCSEKQLLEEAVRIADELAAGSEYGTDFKTKPYQYTTYSGFMSFVHEALMVEGIIEIKNTKKK